MEFNSVCNHTREKNRIPAKYTTTSKLLQVEALELLQFEIIESGAAFKCHREITTRANEALTVQ